MANKMLIDAAHPEETRVVVVRGNRVEEFDFESASRKQLRGNIYLAKVTRVEPSLQAAFVDYGGNRHGFLAFSEIHPDYYQIPVADRQALIEAEQREIEEDHRSDNRTARPKAPPPKRRPCLRSASPRRPANRRMTQARRPRASIPRCEERRDRFADADRQADAAHAAESADAPQPADADGEAAPRADEEAGDADAVEVRQRRAGSSRSAPRTRSRNCPSGASARPRQYKIQEVIKRRQVLLVQVVKEERGNKGAALTTYLSLAGRYSRADAEHRPRRRHLAQDHQRRRPQAPEGGRRRSRRAGGHGRHPAHRRREPHQGRGQARLRISAAPVGERARTDAPLDRADPRLRGRLADQALDPRPLQQGHRRDHRRRRRRLSRGQGLHAHAHAEPCQEREALPRERSRSSPVPASRPSSTRCSRRR